MCYVTMGPSAQSRAGAPARAAPAYVRANLLAVKQAVTFRLPPELLIEAKRIAVRTGMTATAVVEEGLSMVIDRHGDAVSRMSADVQAHEARITRLENIIDRMSEGM